MDFSAYQIKESVESRDDDWDRFVEFEAQGHFEQSSPWAQVKREAGWEPLRILVHQNEKIVAGVQILVRSLPLFGSAGYLPKGPLVSGNDLSLLNMIIRELKKKIEELKLLYVIVQPPNDDDAVNECLKKEGFLKDRVLHVISATTFIDLTQAYETILSNMTRNFRYNIRFAERNGVIIRDGKREEIGLFFKLMLETCRRQGVSPNPSTDSFIQKLWDVFIPHGNIRFFLAEYNGEVVAGLLCIPFGKVCNAWKMGWSGKYENSRAAHFLHWKAIQWAKDNGYHSYNFMGLNRSLAERVLQGNHFYHIAKGADLFKLSFGGDVILLPEAYFYIKNPVLRFGYTGMYPRLRKFQMFGKYPFRIKNDVF